MNNIRVGVFDSMAALVSDEQYYETVKWLCLRARKRIFATIFIVDILPSDDNDQRNLVINLLNDLHSACLRGVDVRIIIGGSKQSLNIQDKTEAAMVHCRQLNIPCQLMSLNTKMSSHKKVVVADDYTLVGSHNWSTGAFSDQIQDSVLIEDPRIASHLAEELAAQWKKLLREGQKNETV